MHLATPKERLEKHISLSAVGEGTGVQTQQQQIQEPSQPQPKNPECPQTTSQQTLLHQPQETTNPTSWPSLSFSPSPRPSHPLTTRTRPAGSEQTSVHNPP